MSYYNDPPDASDYEHPDTCDCNRCVSDSEDRHERKDALLLALAAGTLDEAGHRDLVDVLEECERDGGLTEAEKAVQAELY